jgi:hypothetical protein
MAGILRIFTLFYGCLPKSGQTFQILARTSRFPALKGRV